MSYEEDKFELELGIARAEAAGDMEERDELAERLREKGEVPCAVCGIMIRFHHLDGWQHTEIGLDHAARPDRAGFEWPLALKQPGPRPGMW